MPDTPAEFQHWFALGLRAAAEIAYGFPARTHGGLATAPYAAAEQAAEEIAMAIEAEADALEPQEARDE